MKITATCHVRRATCSHVLRAACFVLVLNGLIAAAADAQTVVVRGVPAGTAIELVVNTEPAITATADAAGDARLSANLFAAPGKSQTDAYLFVDTCKDKRRVVIAERVAQPAPPEPGCERRQVLGLFLLRRVTTLVVNAAGANPTVLLRQGPVNLTPETAWTPAPPGLILFGGGGLAEVRDLLRRGCGSISDCRADVSGWAIAGGATYWFTRYLGAEFSFVKPDEFTVEGNGGTFRFNSFLDTQIFNIEGVVGIPVRRIRFFGRAGTNYHRATSGTTQTIDDQIVIGEDESETVIEGGTQTFGLETAGWGWQFGGGAEVWLAPRLAIYGDVGWTWLKGSALDDADGEIDERVTTAVVGVRLRVGR